MIKNISEVKNGQFFELPAVNGNYYKNNSEFSTQFYKNGKTRKLKNSRLSSVLVVSK